MDHDPRNLTPEQAAVYEGRNWVQDQVREYEASGGTRANVVADFPWQYRDAVGLPIVVITSTGHRTGQPRKNPVIRVEHEGVYAAVASKGGAAKDPAWVRNFINQPLVHLQDGPEPHTYRARLAEGEEREEWWKRAVGIYPRYAWYQMNTERVIPIFLLERADD